MKYGLIDLGKPVFLDARQDKFGNTHYKRVIIIDKAKMDTNVDKQSPP